jgi:uncharacterized membrane protein YfcA
MPAREIVEFLLLGIFVGTYGTLVGAGGGFIIVPILLLFFSGEFTTTQASGTSLTVVFFNGISASLAYIRQRKIDYATGWRFAVATAPSAFIGGQIAHYFGAGAFKLIFGLLLIAVAVLLNLRPEGRMEMTADAAEKPLPPGFVRRVIVDLRRQRYEYQFNLRAGILLGVGIGFLSSILGIGGGIFMVPAMVTLLGFPAQVAVATSSFVLVFTALAGVISHLLRGNVIFGPAIAMSIGVIAGAQVGAAISQLVKGRAIVRVLSIALLITGAQLIAKALGG